MMSTVSGKGPGRRVSRRASWAAGATMATLVTTATAVAAQPTVAQRVGAGAAGANLTAAPSAGIAGQEGPGPRERLVVDVDWLAERMDDPTLVLLHIGEEDAYAAEHIPRARHLALRDIAAPEDHDSGTRLSLELPEPAELETTLERLGIGDDSRIVVYWGEDWVTAATRVVLTLDWIGLGDRTSILDGGMPAWKEAGRPVTAELPGPPREARLTLRPEPDLVVDADWVEAHLDAPGYRILDARAPVHYDGIQATRLHRAEVRKGHIPGAGNLPFSALVDERLRLRPEAELRRLFADAGVEPGDIVVGYCHLGQYATLVLFGARTLGHEVRLYDGSFQDWGSQPDRPVEGPGAERSGPGSDGAGSDWAGSDGAGSDWAGSDWAGSDGAGSDGAGSDR